MVDIRRVEIDGFLDPAQAELFCEELVVLARIPGHRGDVMQTLDLVEHFPAPSLVLCGPCRGPRQYEEPPAGGKGRKHRIDCTLKVNNKATFVHHLANT
jgi:hypothetical protein